jgi:hypothetical protein
LLGRSSGPAQAAIIESRRGKADPSLQIYAVALLDEALFSEPTIEKQRTLFQINKTKQNGRQSVLLTRL